MRIKFKWASGTAVAATLMTALFSANGSGALAEELVPAIIETPSTLQFTAEAVVQELPEASAAGDTPDSDGEPVEPGFVDANSLAQLVRAQPHRETLSAEMKCLAGAIYFEARGESLEGQLAVGRVVTERAASPRFPNSYCGVVFQRSQFSFVRGNRMPEIRTNTQAWRNAVAMARIAHEGRWESRTEGALFFHATHVSPRWRLTRLARVDNHIFYR